MCRNVGFLLSLIDSNLSVKTARKKIEGLMKILQMVLIGLIVLLSIAAGSAKVMNAPQEVEFLKSFGFSDVLILIYGVVQITSGLLLAWPKTRNVGVVATSLAFMLSSSLIFIKGDLIFGFISLIPIAISGYIYLYSAQLLLTKSADVVD